LASFPNQAGANEFLQRLVRARIPGYVVAAQIPHRGTWYRVRAGKFSNAKEQKEAGDDWRQRARAAGIDIQLVPCDYELPLNGK
ncbi:MAG: SPOR domain-containing protein, partial [Blastocatellia bacterium]